MAKKASTLLGDHPIEKRQFPRLSAIFKGFEKKELENCFLCVPVLDFVARIDEEKVLEHYTFNSFELWLNQFSTLSFEANYHVRSKIAGKRISRDDFQILFPIGMGKVYEGTHFVTAHKSPDLDTTIASFWGWMDAFTARVGNGLHVWNLPGGPPASQIEIDWIFRDLFGPGVFTHLPKTRTALNLTGNDLMTQEGMIRKVPSESIGDTDHERDNRAIVITDKEGFFLGNWRNVDVEAVRQVIILLSSCLRWFENTLHLTLITLFAKEKLHAHDIEPSLKHLFNLKLINCEPAHEFSSRQKQQVGDFLKLVIGMKKGLDCTLEELGKELADLCEIPFNGFEAVQRLIKKTKLFDERGHLVEERPRIFSFLESAVKGLHEAILKIRLRLEKLDIALKTKVEVFGHQPTYVTVRSDVEEIRNKIGAYSYLTVAYPDKDKMIPVGVIQASDLRKNTLGTVSLRDFCNREEMTIPPYLEVISVIDHHKSSLNTFSPPMAIIADVQSSNTLVADRAFQINDRYSLSGQDLKSIDTQIKGNPSNRILQRLLSKKMAAESKGSHFIHPEREFVEYLHFLYGIIDDTDLLSKVSAFDVECVVSLLNRLKSIQTGKETEILSLDDLPRGPQFPKKAAEKILRNEEMYSLYRKVYAYREKEVEHNISLCAKGEPSNLFADTKEQNGCCRVGQTKMFARNVSLFNKNGDAIRRMWLGLAKETVEKKPEIDFHLHMISTIVSAEEVYEGGAGKYSHKDELWIWIPEGESAVEHLKRFLNLFQSSPGMKNNTFEVEFLGSNADELALIFKESFIEIPTSRSNKNLPIAVLRYRAGSLNSRKAMVSPFLPKL